MNSESIDVLHAVIWEYINTWRKDETGPWWEGDLSQGIGGLLRKRVADEGHVTIKSLPGILSHWPPNTLFRRLGTENHFPGAGGGMLPDYSYRKLGADSCEWVVELKVWSFNGARKLDTYVDRNVKVFEKDANKYPRERPELALYAFLFMAVNIPARFSDSRRNKYSPEEFVEELVKRLKASADLDKFARAGGGDLCVVVKTIDADARRAELTRCLATRHFGESPYRPPDIDYCQLPYNG